MDMCTKHNKLCLAHFADGTKVRHEAYIKNRLINTLYGVIRNNSIETDGLDKNACIYTFSSPLEFVRAHKLSVIKSAKYQRVSSNGWKIVDYFDETTCNWVALNKYPSTDTCSDNSKKDLIDDDTLSFVTCISHDDQDLDAGVYAGDAGIAQSEDTPIKICWNYVDTVEVWQWAIFAKTEYIENWCKEYNELLCDEWRMDEIEEEIDYEFLDRECPWITRHILPYEEELWIALPTQIPNFGEVWMDGKGHCWEYNEKENEKCIGQWIGKWSWDGFMMDLAAKEPENLMDGETFWNIIENCHDYCSCSCPCSFSYQVLHTPTPPLSDSMKTS